jgi:probable HAF family extracellular repeat protein
MIAAGPLSALSIATAACAQPTFTPLGDLSGDSFYSIGAGVSADGSVICGASESDIGLEPYRWTEAEGMQGLGMLYKGGNANFANDVSADGTIIIGTSGIAHSPLEAFRWTKADGLQGLGDLPGANVASHANALSADGLVVVGRATDDVVGQRPAYWSAADGWQPIGVKPGDAFGVNADASVIVGAAINDDFFSEAFRWTPDTGFEFMGDLDGGITLSTASDVSADGEVIVGWGNDDQTTKAFRWTADEGFEKIGQSLPGEQLSQAMGVSADGNTIVGNANTDDGIGVFFWNPQDGARLLKEYLVDQGVAALENWTFLEAKAVSDDGLTIVGSGFNPDGDVEAYRVQLEAACLADVNRDGRLNILDFVAFQQLWIAQDHVADCDDNGAFNVLDFVCFQQRFVAGCD